MTHKQTCIEQCKEHLHNLSLIQIFSETSFNSFYKKHRGGTANTFFFGLKVADYLITENNNQISKHLNF